jgi:hypothetical protein
MFAWLLRHLFVQCDRWPTAAIFAIFLLANIAFVALLSQHMTALRNPEVFLNFSLRRAAMLATCCKV